MSKPVDLAALDEARGIIEGALAGSEWWKVRAKRWLSAPYASPGTAAPPPMYVSAWSAHGDDPGTAAGAGEPTLVAQWSGFCANPAHDEMCDCGETPKDVAGASGGTTAQVGEAKTPVRCTGSYFNRKHFGPCRAGDRCRSRACGLDAGHKGEHAPAGKDER